MTSVTWIHLAGSGLLRLLLFRKPKRCSLCPLDSCGALEAGRIPSMQYGSLKPEMEQVPQPWGLPQVLRSLVLPGTAARHHQGLPGTHSPLGSLARRFLARMTETFRAYVGACRQKGTRGLHGTKQPQGACHSLPLSPPPWHPSLPHQHCCWSAGTCLAGYSLTLAFFTRMMASMCSSELVPNTCG